MNYNLPQEDQNVNPNLNEAFVTDLKRRVKNYKDVMTKHYQIPMIYLTQTLLIDMDTLSEFVENNSGAAGVRIYFAKNGTNPIKEDYELILVPYAMDNKDILDDEDDVVVTPCCKQPPGCSLKDASLLPDFS